MEQDKSRLCRAGGLAALAIGIGYVIVVALYVPMGAPPRGAEPRLAYLAVHPMTWWAILALSILTDLLFLPLALALYEVLKPVNRYGMMAAVAAMSLFVVLDLALTWTNYAVLIGLAGRYTGAATEVQKAAIIVAAEYPSLVLDSNLVFFYNSASLAAGILIAGFVMRRSSGPFQGAAAYTGIATGVLGFVAVLGPIFTSALSPAIVLASILTTIWAFVAGVKLCRLGESTSPTP